MKEAVWTKVWLMCLNHYVPLPPDSILFIGLLCKFGNIPKALQVRSVQFSSVAQLCLTLCDPMDCSTPGFPVHRQLLELTQTHGHWVGDAIQPSHPLLSPFPLAFNLSQHQGFFQMSQFFTSGGQSIGVLASTSVLPIIFRTDFL